MTDLAGERGFAFVQVRPRPRKDQENRTIGITFEVVEGPRVFVERIEIEGNTQTLDRVIRREIEVVEGDAFDARKIRDAQRRIRALNYFSRVEIETEPGASDDRAVLKVQVEEQSTGSLSFGIGYSSSNGPIGNVALTERNFLGRGQIVNVQVTAAGDTQVYDFNFVEPAFLDRDLSVGFRAFYIDQSATNELNFDVTRLGFGPTVGFPLSDDARLSLNYEFRREDVVVSPASSPALQQDAGVSLISSVGYALFYDQRNDAIEPTAGYLLQLDQDFAGLGGNTRYVRGHPTAKAWTAFLDDQVVASLEMELGGIVGLGDDIKVNERFFLGGASLRGFASQGVGPRDTVTDDALGGNYSAAVRLEVSFPLGLPEELGIYGGLFVDAGSLWGLDGNLIGANGLPIDDKAYLRVGAGALLFVDTPFGPLELSFGTPIIKEDYDEFRTVPAVDRHTFLGADGAWPCHADPARRPRHGDLRGGPGRPAGAGTAAATAARVTGHRRRLARAHPARGRGRAPAPRGRGGDDGPAAGPDRRDQGAVRRGGGGADAAARRAAGGRVRDAHRRFRPTRPSCPARRAGAGRHPAKGLPGRPRGDRRGAALADGEIAPRGRRQHGPQRRSGARHRPVGRPHRPGHRALRRRRTVARHPRCRSLAPARRAARRAFGGYAGGRAMMLDLLRSDAMQAGRVRSGRFGKGDG